MKWVQLTRGFRAKVDDEDFERVSKYWYADLPKDKNHHVVYARAKIKRKTVSMHRFILFLSSSSRSGKSMVDHINLCGRNHSGKKKNYCKLHDFWYEGDKCPRHQLAAMGKR